MSDIRNPLALAGRKALVGGAAAALALSLAAVPTASAQATTFDDATMIWGVNGYAQQGVFAPWRFFGAEGDAEILLGNTRGGNGTQTEYLPAKYPVTSMPNDSSPNAAKFTGGDGTRTADGVVSVDWEGEFTVNAYAESFNAPDETFKDPRLTINPDGSGTLVFDLTFEAAVDMNGQPTPEVNLPDIELLTFSPGDLDIAEDGTITLNADYEGVEYDPSNTSETGTQNRTCSGNDIWGSWSPDFIESLHYSVRPHYFTTSCGGMNNAKGPLPVQLSNVPAPVPSEDGGGDNGGGDNGGGDNGGGDNGGGDNGAGTFGSLSGIFGSLG